MPSLDTAFAMVLGGRGGDRGDGADARHHDGDTAAAQLMGPARDSHRPDSSLGSACMTYTSNITDITVYVRLCVDSHLRGFYVPFNKRDINRLLMCALCGKYARFYVCVMSGT